MNSYQYVLYEVVLLPKIPMTVCDPAWLQPPHTVHNWIAFHVSVTDGVRDFRFGREVDLASLCLQTTNHPWKGRGQGQHDLFSFLEITDNILEMVQDRDIVAGHSCRKVNKQSCVAYRITPLPVTFKDTASGNLECINCSMFRHDFGSIRGLYCQLAYRNCRTS